MACGGCARTSSKTGNNYEEGVVGNFKYLNNKQIKARLESYKRKYCRECVNRYECDFKMYINCRKDKGLSV
jgi:hypothetical protein